MSRCPDCGVEVGQEHKDGCDVERCPECGHQRLSCGCETSRAPLLWTGEWPGLAECRAFNLYAILIPGKGWTPCTKDTPGASEDLNSLMSRPNIVWDPDARRWREK